MSFEMNLQLFGGRGGSSGRGGGGGLEAGYDKDGNFSWEKFKEDTGIDYLAFNAKSIDRPIGEDARLKFLKTLNGERVPLSLIGDEKVDARTAAIRSLVVNEVAREIGVSSSFVYSDHGDMELDYSDYSFSLSNGRRSSDSMGTLHNVSVWKKGGRKPIKQFTLIEREDYGEYGVSESGESVRYNVFRKRSNTRWSKTPSDKYIRAVQERKKYEEYKEKHNR